MTRTRRVVGLLTLLALVFIFLGVTGVQVPLPHVGGSVEQAALPGVRAAAASTLLRVGSGAPPGGELAFMAVESSSGNVVVSDAKRSTVMRFDPSGHLLSEWGPQFGTTLLQQPAGVAVSGNNYFVIDRGTPRILRLDETGQLQAVLDLQSLSTYGLNGLALDANGNIYAADTGRNRILVLAPTGQLIKEIGRAGKDLGAFTQPMMLAFAPDGSFVVADWENSRLERFDQTYQATDAWQTNFRAFGVAVDQTGRVYAPDSDHHRVEAYSPQGAALGEMGAPASPAIDVAPRQVALAASGQASLYVLGGDGIQRLDLENTAPPPQSGPGVDLLSVFVILLMVALVAVAVLSRRQRRSFGAAPGRPVGLHAEDSA